MKNASDVECMKLNTLVPVAVTALVVALVSGCSGTIDYEHGEPKLHIEFKSTTASAENGGEAPASAATAATDAT
jgi:hypothetical protein